jgi:hypothetical protein
MKSIKYKNIEDFDRDLKMLLKKFRTLISDIEIAKINAIELFHLNKINNESVFPIPNFCNSGVKIYKLKKFACKSLKGGGIKSGIRIIYAYYEENEIIDFIEIYYKGDKEIEDKERLKVYLKNFKL